MLHFFEGLKRVKMEQEASKSPEPLSSRPDAAVESCVPKNPHPSATAPNGGQPVRPVPTPCREGRTAGVKREAPADADAVAVGPSPKKGKAAPKVLTRQDFC